MNRTKLTAVSLLIFSCLANWVSAEQTTSNLSPEELKTTARMVKALEDSLLNVRIDSQAWIEEGPSSSGPWHRSPVTFSTTAFYGQIDDPRERIDVHKCVLPWKNGAAPYLQQSYSITFDGVRGKRQEISSSYGGKTFSQHNGFILSKASGQFSGFGRITGVEASLFFLYRDIPEPLPKRFSTNFKAIADPKSYLTALTAAAPKYSHVKPHEAKVVHEKLGGTTCLKMVSMAGSDTTEWWLDPNRGFALLKMDTIHQDPNGHEEQESSINVTSLEKVTEELWWPKEAYFVRPTDKTNNPWQRVVYRASHIMVNDPNFNESVFTLAFPPGYTIRDEIKNKTYVVGKDDK